MKPRPGSDRPRLPSDEALSALAGLCSLLGDGSRLRILLALARNGEVSVAALAEQLGISRGLVSHNLTLLRLADLVNYRREGKNNFYRVEWAKFRAVLGRFFAEAGDKEGTVLNLGGCLLTYRARG